MTHAEQHPYPSDLNTLVGTWRRFGDLGPVYEILSLGHRLDDGNWMLRIRVVEFGEELDYTLSELLADPAED